MNIGMKNYQITQREVDCVILNDYPKGAFFYTYGTVFVNVTFSNIDFSDKKITNIAFSNCYFCDCKFNDSFITDSLFNFCNMAKCSFHNTKVYASDFENSRIACSHFENIHFSDTDFRDCHFEEIAVVGTLHGFKFELACPSNGSFVGYKKAKHGEIVELEIPADAKRSSAFGRKCRCDKAKVLGIYDTKHNLLECTSAQSGWDSNFIYQVGEEISVDDFDENRWNECSTGIHFFITFEEAVDY